MAKFDTLLSAMRTTDTGTGAVDSVNGATGVVVLTTADIADSTDKRYVTDANLTVIGNTSNTNSGDNATNTQYSGLVTNATHTGDVTGSGALTIATGAVTLAKMADMATGSLIYRKTALTGVPEVNTLATLKTDLGLTGTNSGDQDLSSYLTSLSGAVLTDQTVGQTIGTTGARLTKLWATDIEVTNPITGSVTGSAATLTTTRTIWGQNFNGSANVSGALTGVGDITTGNNPTLSWGSNTLSLRSTNAIGVIAIKGSTINDYAARIDMYEGTTTTVGVSLTADGDSYFNGGDFGIGNTNPTQKLHVTGNAYVTAALGVGTTPTTTADIRVNSTATNTSSLYAGIWQSVSYAPASTPSAGANARGLLFQVSTPNVATDLSNVILYGALGQVTHGGSGALGQAIGMNPGVFLTGSGNVTTSAGITLSATASGGGAHTTFYGFRTGGITLSGGSTLVNNYAFYADAVTGATNNYSWLSNAGLFVVNETGDASSDFRVESDTEANMLFLDANGNTNGTFYVGGNSITTAHSSRKGGLFFPVQAATASAPTYVKGALYFDTTLNKLRVGGATAWESITSA